MRSPGPGSCIECRSIPKEARERLARCPIGVDRNTTAVFPAPMMSTIQEFGAFLTRGGYAAGTVPITPMPVPLNGALVAS